MLAMNGGVVSAIVCLLLVSAAWANEPRPCCWINQMTGQAEMQSTVELEDGTVVLEETEMEWAYDATFAAQAFIFTELFENGTTRVARVAKFFNYGVSFYIEENQGQERCVRARIPFQFLRKCIPETAEFDGNRTYGDNALEGHVWKFNAVLEGYATNLTFVRQAEYCVPISFGHVSQEPKIVTVAYGGIEVGICNRDKFFKVPDDCPPAPPGDGESFSGKIKHRHNMMIDSFNVKLF